MANPAQLAHTEVLRVISPAGSTFYGGSQMWYDFRRGRRAGCGPTAASNIIWYLTKSHRRLAALWHQEENPNADFLALMDEMYRHVTPGNRGVNTTGMFCDGVRHFLEQQGVAMEVHSLDIPEEIAERPDRETVKNFLMNALTADYPVAFLNLNNGKVTNLDRWHWVTLVAADPQCLMVTMLDQGRQVDIDLALWLETTTLGGGFVSLCDAPLS